MGLIKIYIDEDAVNRALVLALRTRDVPVLTALEAALTEVDDEKHLAFATERGCVLYTYNVSDSIGCIQNGSTPAARTPG